MNFFHHNDLGNHLLQLCPKVVKHPVYTLLQYTLSALLTEVDHFDSNGSSKHTVFYLVSPVFNHMADVKV